MPSLRDQQRRFADDLLRRGGGPCVAGEALSHPDARMAVYRGTIRSNYRNALGATYPAVRRIVGSSFFVGAVDAYVAAHPSRSGDLNEYGDVFADFLERYPPAGELAYLPDVARLEWAVDEANRAPDERLRPEAVLCALSRLAPSELPGLRLRIARSSSLLGSPFPVLRIWQVNQADYDGDLEVDFAAGPDRLRIRREPTDGEQGRYPSARVLIERLDAGDFQWLWALAHEATLATAIERARIADPMFDLQAALHRFVGDGTIAGAGARVAARDL